MEGGRTTSQSPSEEQCRGLFLRLLLELLEPVVYHDQLVGNAGEGLPEHQEPAVVRGKSEVDEEIGGESGRVKEHYRAAERQCRIGLYVHFHHVAGGVRVEQLASLMRP